MTDVQAPGAITLETVRTRFLDAEKHLIEASRALGDLQSNIQQLGMAREGLREAGREVGQMREVFAGSFTALQTSVALLREGTEALMKGEPAQILRRIDLLEAAVHAAQSATLERLGVLDQRAEARAERQRADEQRREELFGAAAREVQESLRGLRDTLAVTSGELNSVRSVLELAGTEFHARAEGLEAGVRRLGTEHADQAADIAARLVSLRNETRVAAAAIIILLLGIVAFFKFG